MAIIGNIPYFQTNPDGVPESGKASAMGSPEPRTALHPHSIEPWSDQVPRDTHGTAAPVVFIAPNPRLRDSFPAELLNQ